MIKGVQAALGESVSIDRNARRGGNAAEKARGGNGGGKRGPEFVGAGAEQGIVFAALDQERFRASAQKGSGGCQFRVDGGGVQAEIRPLARQQAGKIAQESVGAVHKPHAVSGGGLFMREAGQGLACGKMDGRGKMGGAGSGPGMQGAAAVLFKHVQTDPGKAELPDMEQNVSGQGRAA